MYDKTGKPLTTTHVEVTAIWTNGAPQLVAKHKVISRLCNLPLDLQRLRTKSFNELISDGGYPEAVGKITRVDLAVFLKQNPHLVDAWEHDSEDQRIGRGWAFRQNATGSIVVEVPTGITLRFSDRFEGCAENILRRI